MMNGLKPLSCEDRLRGLGAFCLEKRILWGDLTGFPVLTGKIGQDYLQKCVVTGQGGMG